MSICIKRFALPTLLAAAAILGGVSLAPAGAQTVEETVAFMLWGLEEGPRTKQVDNNRWEVDGHNGDKSIYRIVPVTDCLFNISSQVQRAGPADLLEFDYVLDFSAALDYSAWFANQSDHRIIVKIEGKGWYSKTVLNKVTGQVVQKIRGGSVDAYMADGGSVERLKGAFTYFRTTFCSGRAL